MENSPTKISNGINGVTGHPKTCCGSGHKCTNWIPQEYKNETVQLLKLAGPVTISQLMIFLISFVSTMFCGHLGKTELAGVALATAMINVTGISVGRGLAATCDTLISQTYGSGNLKRVGVILQRGVLILLLACFPCWAVLINTEPLLLAVRQSRQVARLSELYVKIFMPALPAVFMFQLQAKYLENQGIVWPQVITGAMANVLNALINYLFLHQLDLGVAGSAAANSISQYFLAVFLYVYICWRGLHKATWNGGAQGTIHHHHQLLTLRGWSRECLQEWGPFIQLAIPSMLMFCLEWWVYEIGGFLAGLISEEELAAQSAVSQLVSIAYMFPLGFDVAVGVRVGNALGAGDTEQAKLSGKVSLICSFVVSCFVGTIIGVSKDVIGYIFTTEQDIVQRVADVMIMYAFFLLAEAVAGVTRGIVRGAGKQMIGALCLLVGFYFVGLPIGVSLMFAAQMGIIGFWSGVFICVVVQTTFFIIFLWKLDWKKATHEALVRAGIQVPEEDNTFEMEKKGLIQHSEQNSEEGITDVGLEAGPKQTSVSTVGAVLSVRQLVLRRGLAVLIMFLVLAAGIIICQVLTRLLS